MKTTFLKTSAILLLFVPLLALADIPGGGLRWHTAFEVANSGKFQDYTFYYSKGEAEQKIDQGKTYSFTHPGAPTVDWHILIYAKNNASGVITLKTPVGADGKKDTLTIREIKGDAIVFDKTTTDYPGESIPSAAQSGSNLTSILGGVAVTALLVFGALVLMRKKKS